MHVKRIFIQVTLSTNVENCAFHAGARRFAALVQGQLHPRVFSVLFLCSSFAHVSRGTGFRRQVATSPPVLKIL